MKNKSCNIHLCSAKDCTGCFSCEGICPVHAIGHAIDKEGFHYPIIDDSICIGCRSCEKKCPVLNPVKKNKNSVAYAAWSLSDDVRQKSSSGGIFSEVATYILENGGIVVGAELGKDGYVRHTVVREINELYRLRGSKYVQSIMTAELYRDIKDAIKDNKQVLFSGTPCQVAAVRSVFKNSPLILTLDIICHGVPSPKLFNRVYNEIKDKYKGFESFNFRMLKIWGEGFNIDKKTEKGIENISLPIEDSYYLEAFDKGLLSRGCCYSCKYATMERVSDITVGDFWGIGTTHPFDFDTKKGCSIVLVNSDNGKQLVNSIKKNLFTEQREAKETVLCGNEQLQQPSQKPKGRDTIYVDFAIKDTKSVIKKYHLIPKKKSFFSRAVGKVLRMIKLK